MYKLKSNKLDNDPYLKRRTSASKPSWTQLTHAVTAPMPLTRQDLCPVAHRQAYLLKACRTLIMYGAPTHRLEAYIHATAEVLELQVQSFYMPGCMIISFNDTGADSAVVHIVRCTQELNLSKLYDVHAVYKDVIHKRKTVEEATVCLDQIMFEKDKFPLWFRIAMYGLASAAVGPVSYGARPIDLPIIFVLGSLVGFLDLVVSKRSELYGHVLEISATIVVSFTARALGSIFSGPDRLFCFSALSQASIVLILPGFIITNSALELQSRNLVSGAVRMVYGIIYTLFLAFGTTVGATIWGAIDSNAVSDIQCHGTWPFWWQVVFVAPFTLGYTLVNQVKWKKLPAMTILTLIGWLVNHFATQRFAANPQVAQIFGALSVGILANLCSRLGYGLAVALLYPAVYIQVPGSFAASGGLLSGVTGANRLTRSGNDTVTNSGPQTNFPLLKAGYSMIEIAIGLTVGLSIATLVVYPSRRKTGKSGIFSF